MVYKVATFVFSLGLVLISLGPLLLYYSIPCDSSALLLAGSSLMVISLPAMKVVITTGGLDASFSLMFLGSLLSLIYALYTVFYILSRHYLYLGLLLVAIGMLTFSLRGKIRKTRCVLGLFLVFIGSLTQTLSLYLYRKAYALSQLTWPIGSIIAALGILLVASVESFIY